MYLLCDGFLCLSPILIILIETAICFIPVAVKIPKVIILKSKFLNAEKIEKAKFRRDKKPKDTNTRKLKSQISQNPEKSK